VSWTHRRVSLANVLETPARPASVRDTHLASHTQQRRSSPPDATSEPRGENATAHTTARCSRRPRPSPARSRPPEHAQLFAPEAPRSLRPKRGWRERVTLPGWVGIHLWRCSRERPRRRRPRRRALARRVRAPRCARRAAPRVRQTAMAAVDARRKAIRLRTMAGDAAAGGGRAWSRCSRAPPAPAACCPCTRPRRAPPCAGRRGSCRQSAAAFAANKE
jgi:hypothetical protein